MADLRIELAKRGLRGTEGKASLQQRLKEGLHLMVGAPGGEKRNSSMSGLPFLAWWELLDPDLTPIQEPINEDGTLRPPTKRDAPVNPKYGCGNIFDRHPFTGTDAKLSGPKVSSSRKRAHKKRRRLTPDRNMKEGYI